MDPAIIAAAVGGACALILLISGLRVVSDYERGVVLRVGRRRPLLEPGLRLIIPFGVDRLIRVDLRTSMLEITAHEVVTRDGVPVRVTVEVQYQVLNPVLAVTRVVDYRASTASLVRSALRDVVTRTGLRDVLVDQEAIRSGMVRFVDTRTEPWGIRVTSVDVRDVELPEALHRAMARQAEIRGDEQVQRVHADAEAEVAHRLAEAAQYFATQPQDVQLQFLRALTQVGNGSSTVLVVPLPGELVQPFIDLQGRAAARSEQAGGEPQQALTDEEINDLTRRMSYGGE